MKLLMVECSGPDISAAVEAVGKMFSGTRAGMPLVETAPVAALPAPEIVQVEEPRPAKKAKRGSRPRKAAEPAPAAPRRTNHVPVKVIPSRWADKPTLCNAIRACLSSGPADISQLTAYVQANGFPEADYRSVGNNAYALRRKGELEHSDDGKYSLPEA